MQGGHSGLGARSHIYIQHPPLRCDIPETRGLYYDDGNKFLLTPTSDQVFYWKLAPSMQNDPPNSDSINEGPVLSIRYSLDQKLIAILTSDHEVQFKVRETGATFSRRCKDSEKILGFFWTDCPTCDIIFVKTSGIEMLSFEDDLNAIRLVEAKRFTVSWYIYTHESRLVLLASGMQCSTFIGYQFSSVGIVRLPKFEMTMAKNEANFKPVLDADDVHIVTVYGRIYCLQHDKVSMELNLYRFYRDAVVQQGTVPTYSRKIAVSSVDNVILVHQVDAKVVLLYDVFLDSLTPVSAPLPLLIKGESSGPRQANQYVLATTYESTIYGERWHFLVPDLICDVNNGLLWKISLDLEAIAASSSDVPATLEFLQRRRSDPIMIKTLCIAIMRTTILERRPLSTIVKAMNVLVESYSQLLKIGISHTIDKGSSEQAHQAAENATVGSNIATAECSTGNMGHESLGSGRRSSAAHQMSISHIEQEVDDNGAEPTSDSDDNTNSRVSERNIEKRPEQVSIVQTSESTVAEPSMRIESSEPLAVSASERLRSQFASVVISPDEMYHAVFCHIEDEMTEDSAYLIAIIIEFLRSSMKEKLKVSSPLYVMLTALLLRSDHHAEISLFVSNKILVPSKDVALQFLASGQQNSLMRKLGMNMLRELALHQYYINALLQDGYYLDAVRYARKHKVITVPPSFYLEAACKKNNPQHLAAILRFFADSVPSFKSSAEFGRYYRVLTQTQAS